MSARALAKLGLAPIPHIDLPVGSRPQLVNDAGFEVDEDEPKGDSVDAVVPEDAGGEVNDIELQGGTNDSDVNVDETHERGEALLSLAERPRVRPIAKGTFLFPTPPPLEPPLPLKEYHAPAKPPLGAPTTLTSNESPAPESAGTPDTATQARPIKAKAKSRERSIAPAHEIECIARVTLSIGPISYPGTEIWMGRFVNPRGDQPNGPRRREKVDTPNVTVPKKRKSEANTSGAVKEKKKHLPAIAGMTVKASPSPTPNIRPPRPPAAGPIRPPAAPQTRPPPAGTSLGRPPRPTPTRPPIEPDLIQRVNQAATQHPWLSVIIHKAARNTASKEELAKLGRIVARLGKGEGVGEGPLDGLPQAPAAVVSSGINATASRSPAHTTEADTKPKAGDIPKTPAPASGSSSNKATSADIKTSSSKTKQSTPAAISPPEDDDSSDDDLDMTGEPQTGGGPIDPELRPDVARQSSTIPATSSTVPTDSAPAVPTVTPSSPAPGVKAPQRTTPVPMVLAGHEPLRVPTPNVSVTPAAQSQTTPIALNPSSIAGPSGTQATVAPVSAAAPNFPPPSPSRVYPLPPPFLLVAFKETPTEKFLLPLGSQSYVSRIGSPLVERTSIPGGKEASVVSIAGCAVNTQAQDQNSTATEVAAVPHPASNRGRTRQSLGRATSSTAHDVKKEESSNANAGRDDPLEDAKASAAQPPIRSGLSSLPGSAPAKGTVLLSTIIPVEDWLKPDWEPLAKRMPFYSRAYDETNTAPTSNQTEPGASSSTAVDNVKSPKSPKTRTRDPPSPRSQRKVDSTTQMTGAPKIDPHTLLNMGAESFMPAKCNVRAVTIRLEGVDDAAWHKMRWVMDHIDGVEMKALGDAQPNLLENNTPVLAEPVAPAMPLSEASPVPIPPRPPMPKPFNPSQHPRLRKAYDEYRKHRIEGLLQRVPRRTFPKYRLSAPRTDIKDAMSDRWAPRKYPMSTRPLYLTSPPPEGVEYEEEEIVPQPKRKRGQVEEDVMFEMPVSLDMLDERVEAGAKKSVNRRVGKLKLGKNKTPRSSTGEGRVKNVGKRSKPGMVCEGCARTDQKVWRKGPGGKGTLCNECGDKYGVGTLGELLAPGAASAAREEAEDDLEVKAEEVGGAGAPNKMSPVPTTVTGEIAEPVGAEDEAADGALAELDDRSRDEEAGYWSAGAPAPPEAGVQAKQPEGNTEEDAIEVDDTTA